VLGWDGDALTYARAPVRQAGFLGEGSGRTIAAWSWDRRQARLHCCCEL